MLINIQNFEYKILCIGNRKHLCGYTFIQYVKKKLLLWAWILFLHFLDMIYWGVETWYHGKGAFFLCNWIQFHPRFKLITMHRVKKEYAMITTICHIPNHWSCKIQMFIPFVQVLMITVAVNYNKATVIHCTIS